MPVRQPSATKRDEQHDRQRLDEGVHEFADRVLDHLGLVGDLLDIDALRHRLHEFRGRVRDVLAEFEDVGALGGDHADAERGLAFLAHHEARRIDIAMGDGGDVAEPEHAAVALDRRLRHRLDAIERAGDAQRHALRRGFHRAGRHDVVLLGERIEQRLRRDAERRQLGMRELDEDLLVLGAVEVDLGDARHLQQPLAHAFGGLLQLRVVGAVAGHHVEDGIDVAEFVVDDRAEQARRQLALHVGELLAQQIEQIRHVLGRRRILERDLHRGEGRLRIGLHLLEIGQFLQLLLDRIGDLRLHFRRGRARPDRRDVHHLDGEERILGAAEPLIGEEAGDAERDDQEQDQRGMADRPARKIEALHRTLPNSKPCVLVIASQELPCANASRLSQAMTAQNDNDETTRTFWAGSSFCTPSTTTFAPSSTPPVMTTSLLS